MTPQISPATLRRIADQLAIARDPNAPPSVRESAVEHAIAELRLLADGEPVERELSTGPWPRFLARKLAADGERV